MRKIFLIFYFLLKSTFIIEGEVSSLKEIVSTLEINKNLTEIVEAVTLEGNFEDFKRSLSLDLTSSAAQKGQRQGSQIDGLIKVYCTIRAIKELSKEELWFRERGMVSSSSTRYHDIYLLAHVMYGHLLSPFFGEPSSIKIYRNKGQTNYFNPNCNAWRVDDTSRKNPLFIVLFVYEISKMFQNIVSYGDIEIQDDGKNIFNVILYTEFQRAKNPAINIGDSIFSRTYSDAKAKLGGTIPQTNDILNLHLKSVTLMIDPNVLSERHENIDIAPSPSTVPAVFDIAQGIYQSRIFQQPYALLQKLIDFLNEFNDISSRGDKRIRVSNRSTNSRGSSMATGSGNGLTSKLVVSTLWPEFVRDNTDKL